jgi:hypothetical protein
LIQVSHGIEDTQPSPYRSLGVIFMSVRVAEIDEQPVTKQLGDMPIVALDDVGTHSLIYTHHIPILFGVELQR